MPKQIAQTDRHAKPLDPNYIQLIDVQTGRRDDRPNFQVLLKLIESRQVDRVIVTRVDRLGRDVESNARLAKLLERTGVEIFETLLGGVIDWRNLHDWHYFVEAGVKAEGESRMLSARVKQTFDWYREQGKPAGGGTPFGYRRVNGLYEPDPETWPIAVETVKIIIDCGGTPSEAVRRAREIGFDMTGAGLYGWIRLDTIRGHTKQLDKVLLNTHRSLFDEPELLAINALRDIDRIISKAGRMRGRNRQNRMYPLSGLVFCGRCGGTCHIKTIRSAKYPTNTYTYICCGFRQSRSADCGGQYGAYMGRKRTINTPYPLADKAVIDALSNAATAIVQRSVELDANPLDEPAEAKKLRSLIAKYEAMGDPDLSPVIEAKQAQLRELLSTKISTDVQREAKIKELLHYAAIPRFWELATDEEKVIIYQDFVDRVICDRENVTVKLKI